MGPFFFEGQVYEWGRFCTPVPKLSLSYPHEGPARFYYYYFYFVMLCFLCVIWKAIFSNLNFFFFYIYGPSKSPNNNKNPQDPR